MCGGCAHLPEYWRSGSALDFWAAAVEADDSGRDVMWQAARRDHRPWQLALLQSLPDYHRHDARAASRALKQVAETHPSSEIGALARVRLADLENRRACESQALELRHRLDEVIAIERKLDGNAP